MSRVFVPIPISGIEEEKEQPSLTYKLDLDTASSERLTASKPSTSLF